MFFRFQMLVKNIYDNCARIQKKYCVDASGNLSDGITEWLNLLQDYSVIFDTAKDCKDESVANLAKDRGNQLYKKRQFIKAIEMYSKVMVFIFHGF